MTRRNGLREKWRRAVVASDMGDAVKVTLIAKSLWMTEAGYVSVPRETIADLLDKHPRKIGEHITAAVRGGYLAKISGGYKGVTAQYVAMIPCPKGGRLPATNQAEICKESATFERPPLTTESGSKVAAYRPPITRASVSERRERHDGERNAGVERDRVQPQERSERRAPARSLVDALSPSSGRRLACAGLRQRVAA